MLPNKETNSSEESECDDLDPNTSMEVETIILVIYFFFQEHVPVLKCLCWKGSWWVCLAHGHMCQLSVSHTKRQFWFCQAVNWSLGCLCDGSSGGRWGTSSCWAGGSCSHPQSPFPTWDLIQWNNDACTSTFYMHVPFYIKKTPCPGNTCWAASQACVRNHWSKCCCATTSALNYLGDQKRQRFFFLLAEWEIALL